jgi:hemolysin III
VVEAPAVRHRAQSLGEEIANSISHGTGFLAALITLPVLVIDAVRHGTAAIVGAGVFAATMALLYLTSTLYHALAPNRAKRVFQILDHVAIYLLIAGTYTPFTLGVLWGPWGWTLFGLIWALAIAGIVLKSVGGVRHPRISTGFYVVMGWLILAAAKPLWHAMPGWGLFWLAAGGVAYTARLDSMPPTGCGTPTLCGTCSYSRARRVTSLPCYNTRPNRRFRTVATSLTTSRSCTAPKASSRRPSRSATLSTLLTNWLLNFSKTAHSYRYREQGPKIAASKNYRFRPAEGYNHRLRHAGDFIRHIPSRCYPVISSQSA